MNSSFDFIREKVEKSSDVLSASIEETPANSRNFQTLLAAFNVWRAKKFPGNLLTLHLKEDQIESIDVKTGIKNFESETIPCFQNCTIVELDVGLKPCNKSNISLSDTASARDSFRDLSENGYVVILISKDGITYFSRGREFNRFGSNVFLTAADLKRWAKKRTISEALDVLKDYRVRIRKRAVYEKFFVSKSTLKRIKYLPKKNLLKNKPESIMRDDLKLFLTEQIQGTFNVGMEILMDDLKRLDVNVTDENGDYYFFEVKWIGESIRATDDAVGTQFGIKDAKSGMGQSLGYCRTLESEDKVVKVGYLVVFDAREGRNNDALSDFSTDEIDDSDLRDYLPRFVVLEPFCIDNTHPR